ncbi:Subunit of the glycosylphosphatidylinositol transamidase complex-like protein [Stygiomarasmius scandens]|uniref:Subunit of the glycosylphosphatidylinositol transamidase complex-like protein n=1 Tax=Marasmiellus scandens TaxID=2682957 RepID=A0ABR1K0F7_9AGAR
MHWRPLCLLVLGLFPSFAQTTSPHEQFDEELVVKSFQDGRVASTFTFKTLLTDASPRDPRTLALEDDEPQHYTLFPLTLGQLLRQYAITELHLTLNAGKWKYDSWGYPEAAGVGTGAELYAWLADGAPSSIDERWQGLRNALAGLFCASLGSLDEQRTTSPHLSFPPEGLLPDWDGLQHEIRHASHASEHVCTENLTPFLKLLPCKSLSGLASLLNPHRMFDADWHGIGLHVLWRPEGVEVRLNFQMVSDPLRPSGKKQDWSFRSLYDRSVDRACPVAKTSRTIVTLPDAVYSITPEPSAIESGKALYDLKNKSPNESFDMKLEWGSDFVYPQASLTSPLVPFTVQRKLHGPTQDRGQLALVLKNHEPHAIRVSYLETMPWLLQFYLHTIRIEVDGTRRDDLISNISYVLPVPHSRPATFHCILTLPGHSTVTYTIDVTKAFLMYTEHPPDAQRGWDLPPAVFVLLASSSEEGYTRSMGGVQEGSRVYTPSLLVDLATPDFSMPYNVIIFTCSVVAFIFGSIFNLLTRKFVVVRLDG